MTLEATPRVSWAALMDLVQLLADTVALCSSSEGGTDATRPEARCNTSMGAVGAAGAAPATATVERAAARGAARFTLLLARLLREADGATAAAGPGEEVGDE
jgi:hypothetical protein